MTVALDFVFYCQTDSDGSISSIGSCHSGAFGAASGRVQIAEADYQLLIAPPPPGQNRQAYHLLNGVVTLLHPPFDLAAAQATAASGIDNAAEMARLQFITGGSGQAMVYQEKAAEADALLAQFPTDADTAGADLSAYPLVTGEVGLTADDAWGVATVFAAKRDAWKQVAAAIETVRLTAQAAVTAATTQAEIDAAVNGLAWPAAPPGGTP